VLTHEEDQSLLRAYISEWRKFFTQCSYLPMPFFQLETALQVIVNIILSLDFRFSHLNCISKYQGKSHSSIQKKPQQNTDDSLVRKVISIEIIRVN